MQITLKNLHQATAQQVFDQVAVHLLTQGEQSGRPPSFEGSTSIVCMYRGPIELKCAAGCLIGDDEYFSEMENTSWFRLIEEYPQLITERHKLLICDLQSMHDGHRSHGWRSRLIKIANEHGLSADIVYNTKGKV